jgi:hypothetical protein
MSDAPRDTAEDDINRAERFLTVVEAVFLAGSGYVVAVTLAMMIDQVPFVASTGTSVAIIVLSCALGIGHLIRGVR